MGTCKKGGGNNKVHTQKDTRDVFEGEKIKEIKVQNKSINVYDLSLPVTDFNVTSQFNRENYISVLHIIIQSFENIMLKVESVSDT